MDNENKNKLSENQMAQVAGGDIPNLPNTYGERVCPACGSTDVGYSYTDVGFDEYMNQVQSEVYICNSCKSLFVRIAKYV